MRIRNPITLWDIVWDKRLKRAVWLGLLNPVSSTGKGVCSQVRGLLMVLVISCDAAYGFLDALFATLPPTHGVLGPRCDRHRNLTGLHHNAVVGRWPRAS